jgi:hypothetical protein
MMLGAAVRSLVRGMLVVTLKFGIMVFMILKRKIQVRGPRIKGSPPCQGQ